MRNMLQKIRNFIVSSWVCGQWTMVGRFFDSLRFVQCFDFWKAIEMSSGGTVCGDVIMPMIADVDFYYRCGIAISLAQGLGYFFRLLEEKECRSKKGE